MSDLISRQAVIDSLEADAEMLKRVLDDTDIVGSERDKFAWGLGMIESFISDMKELPSAQSDSKPGYWIVKEGETAFWDVCSKCGKKTIHRMPHFKYCPYCRKRMEV